MITPEIIDEAKKRLIKVYDPLEIYLFGSYAWGIPEEDSDLDLLIVVEKSDQNSIERLYPGYDALMDLRIANDLIVYTKEEFDKKVSNVGTFIYKIKVKGKRIYERA